MATDHSRRRPDDLLPIGLFSYLTSLSHKALHLYAHEGLLEPAYVDPETGYRYYARSQMANAEVLRLLRSLDVPLAALSGVMAADDRETAVRTTMSERLRSIDLELDRLTSIRERLDALLAKETLPFERAEVEVVELDDLVGFSHREPCYQDDLSETEWRAIHEFEREYASRGLVPAGREWVIYHDDMIEWEPHDLEVFQPIDTSQLTTEAVELATLPGGPAVRMLHAGDYDDIRLAYAELLRRATERGLRLTDSPRERYLVDERDSDDPRDYRTEIAWPLRNGAR
jgi:effector-binding domain-containing protein